MVVRRCIAPAVAELKTRRFAAALLAFSPVCGRHKCEGSNSLSSYGPRRPKGKVLRELAHEYTVATDIDLL